MNVILKPKYSLFIVVLSFSAAVVTVGIITAEETYRSDRQRNRPRGGKGGIQRLGTCLRANRCAAGGTKKEVQPHNFRHNLFYGLGFIFSSIAGPSQDKDLGVMNETVSDSRGHRSGIEDLSPISNGQVSGQQG